MEDVDEIVREFLVESYENLDQLDRDLVALEESPGSRPLLSSVFRTIHTIKGTSGFLAFGRLERRRARGREPAGRAARRSAVDGPADHRRAAAPGRHACARSSPRSRRTAPRATSRSTRWSPAVEARPRGPAVVEARVVEPHRSSSGRGARGTGRRRAGRRRAASPRPPVVRAPSSPPQPVPPAAEHLADEERRAAQRRRHLHPRRRRPARRAHAAGRRARAGPQPDQPARRRRREDVDLARSAQRLNLIAGELQEGVMKTRMQPIEHVWSKMPRIVRDLAAACGREVQLEMAGGDTELDRGLLEAVKDPLTHLVRNAVDHGIEPADARLAAGKPARGRAARCGRTTRAARSSSRWRDDGRGIDPERVGAKAVEKGLRTADQLAADEHRRAAPAAVPAGLLHRRGRHQRVRPRRRHGRGPHQHRGDRRHGRRRLDASGPGTVWRLRIPLTLAIMPALTVECAGDLYAMPQVQPARARRARRRSGPARASSTCTRRRSTGCAASCCRWSRSPRVLGVDDGRGGRAPSVIAVVQADQQRFGLLVDRVLNTEEIVVKPLSARLKAIGVYAGATVLGDGRVALILDVQAIARRALVGDLEQASSDATRRGEAEAAATVAARAGAGRRASAKGAGSRCRSRRWRGSSTCAPTRSSSSAAARSSQYRGTILPLARLDRLLGAYGDARRPTSCWSSSTRRGGRSVGLVVRRDRRHRRRRRRAALRHRGPRPGRLDGAGRPGHRAARRARGGPRRRPRLLRRARAGPTHRRPGGSRAMSQYVTFTLDGSLYGDRRGQRVQEVLRAHARTRVPARARRRRRAGQPARPGGAHDRPAHPAGPAGRAPTRPSR